MGKCFGYLASERLPIFRASRGAGLYRPTQGGRQTDTPTMPIDNYGDSAR